MLRYKSSTPAVQEQPPTNNGGFLGGLGYLANKAGIGFMQTFEGAWDYAAGGIADLFGADEWARRQMENDWFGDWYYSADKNFNPGKGWKAAGDVAGGVGNQLAGVSAAALAVASAVGITMATGGTGLPVSAAVIGSTASGITAGLAAAGNSTKEAYAKTGKLTGKEYGYGTLVGATEGMIEAASNLIAPGAGKVGKGIYKAIAGEAAEGAAKTGLSKVLGTAVKHAGTNFISEAVEEGTAEILAPQYAKLTYDPNAENATAEEIAYASFIGGLSGVLAGGGEAAILGTSNSVANYRAGKKAVEAGYTAEIEGVAKRIAEEEAKKPSGYALFEKIREVYERQGSGYGRIGALQRMTAASRYLPAVEESAKAIVSNPEYSAARFLAIGAKNPDGTPLEITPEKLTEGFDPSADSETALHSLRRALSTNPLLLTLSVADATGKMMLDAENYAGLLTGGGVLTTRGDYQTFLAKASDEQKAAVAQHFGLTAPLDSIPYEDMVNIATGYAATPEGRAAIEAVGNVRYRAEQIEKNDKPLPKVVGEALADGIYRYGDVAIIKEGGSVRIYDYETRSITMAMTPKEATAALQKYRREQDTAKAEERRAKAEEQRKAREEELDTWAREHIKRYRELVGNEQREIRTIIRQGRALGLSDADIETYATVSARSSVRVTFSKVQCRRESVEMKDGKPVVLVGYADGFYSPETNEIVVNPEGKRSAAKLLMHELSHALYKDRKFAEVIDGEVKHMDDKRKGEVRELYEKAGRAKAEISEELSVHHAEDVVANRDNLARMMKEEPTLGDKILSFFKLAKTDYKGHNRLSLAAGRLYRTFETLLASFSEFNRGNLAAEANPLAMRESMADARFALQFSDNIAEGQRAYLASHQGVIEDSELTKAIEDTAKMVKKMLPHKDILPTDTVGKKGATLVKNGSYDVSVENTTVCIRTLSYNAFTDMVSEKIGRPLSQMESFLVSQKLYDIAKEPQCLYCYVSLDRKAFNEMIIRYTEQRDAAVKAWEDAGKPSVSRSSELYEKFRAGRKDTDNMWKRYNEWISAAKSGDKLITLADVATESRRADIAHNGTASQKAQIADMLKYAQSASWAKKQTKYVAYYDDILRLSPKAVKDLNKHYGLRWYSFSDYSGAFIVENMQQVTDASLRGLKGLSYTKDVDFARIFAPTGMNINISVYATDINGKWEIDPKQSADIDAAIKLREQYPNVGIVVVAAKREGVEWALAQEWSDVVIPFHIVRSGQDVANFYDWEVFNSEQGDTVMDENLWSQYVESLGNPKKVSKSIYPSEHQNSRETYLDLCKSRGIKPRFSSFLDNPNYMKLVNETRQREADTMPLRPTFDLGAAEKSFDRFVEKGGYYEGWYNDGVDISAEVDIVAADVLAGKKANEVSYGRQDKHGNPIPTPAELMASRKANRSHGRRDALPEEVNTLDKNSSRRDALPSDAEYMTAVESGDMETAQRMVDEAAKAAGYSTEHLYHGTSMFGFTNIDVSSASDDSISFFATNRKEVASGYMPWYEDDASDLHHDDVRRIGFPDKSRPRGLSRSDSAERILTEAQKVFPEYKDTRVATDDEVLADLKTYWLPETIEAAEKLREIELSIGSNKLRQQVRDMCDAVIAASKEDTLDAWKAVGNRYKEFDSIDIPYDATDMRPYIFRSRILGGLQQIGKFAKTTAIMLEGELTSTADIVLRYNSFLGGETLGMYDLYTKQGNQLVIQGRGSSWKQLPLGKFEVEYMEWLGDNASEELSGKSVTTRDVAAFAKAKGYRSVAFYDIYDNGAYGGAADISDVYAFFYPNEDVKSADPVTYDDNGNIIPLSERFNPKQSDIRYALPATTEELPNGTRVRANDRGNIGVIVGHNAGVYSVKFTSKDGLSRTLQMTSADFSVAKKTSTKKTQTASAASSSPIDTTGSVGKTKDEYKADFRDKVFTAKTRTYIDTVDELYGIVTYLRKVGKIDKPAAEAMVQQARAARSQAQTMIGSAQYNVFSDKVERMGDGLLEILKPAQKWTEEKRIAFDDYLLHQLNIDRMTLESRSFVWAAPLRRTVQTLENNLAALENRKKQLTSDIGKKQTALNNAKVRRGVVKTAKAKEVWNKQVDTFARELSALNDLLKEAKRAIAKKKKELGKAKEEYEAALLKNKPVFGKDETLDEDGNMKRDHDITADESRDIVKKYDAAHPEFANLAKRLYAYLDNVQNLRVEAGIITQDMADRMKQLYPHYVPSYRDVEGGGISSIKGKNAMEVSKTVRKAKGGNQDILDVSVSIAMQTDEVLKAGQINKLARALYDAAKASGDDTYVKILSEEAVGSEEDAVDTVMRPKPGQLTFYADGKRVTLEISKELLTGFDGLRKPSVDFESPVMQALAFLNTWYKRGVTSMNPAFAIRNPIRDLQDAGLNSKHPVLFARYMMTVGKEMLQNSADWELYRAMGGFSSTVFDGSLKDKAGRSGFEALAKVFGTNGEVNFAEVFKRAKNLLKNGLTTIENINAFLEQTTRFAEFKASLAAGDSPAVALNNSAEVTTNFGRRGKLTKALNATVMPFLNPAIQGFDKIFRNVGDAFTGGHWVRGMAWLITKAAIIGIAPMLLNSLMYDDDEEYEKLRETDKENNFLIKTADGTFIKIPRGRLASVIGGLYNRGDKLAKGEDAELAGYASNVVSQVTPVENVSRTIFSPIFDVKNNRTWYGGEIEGREWDDTAPRDRYDESTSSIAVWIGQAINYSPKKVHYLLDQYSGVIGDFVLPATSKKEKKDFFSGNFTLDSVTSNKLSERFYDAYDKTAYADTAGDEAATYRLKYLNDVKKAVRDMNKELDEIRNSDLSNTEKLQQTRVVRSLINAAYDSALKSLDAVNAAIEATKGLDTAAIEAGYTKDMAEKLREAEVNRRVFGAEYALKQYNEKTYEKYVLLNGGGIGYDELYAFHFSTIGLESDLDKKGNVIEGSKKKKILAVINSLDIPKEQKLILLASRGYTPRDGDIKGVSAARAKTVLAAYIAKAKGLTKAQREELAKACGLKVTNGRISVK